MKEIDLLKEIVEEGCCPEFDSWYDDDTGDLWWVCLYYNARVITFGKTPKASREHTDFLKLLEEVKLDLGI